MSEINYGSLLPLQGVVNFRDMGGLETTDEKKVKKGLLFRSAELTGLTEEDMKLLDTLQIRYVFDYRRDSEAVGKPTPTIRNAQYSRVSVMSDDNITTHMTSSDLKEGREYYRKFTEENFFKIYSEMPIGNPSFKRLMTLLKSPKQNLPLVHHCTGGRDRTGVGAMIILLTLGVPYETVIEDFLQSNIALENYHNKIFKKAARFLQDEELHQFKNAFLLKRDYLDKAMDTIIHTYGDFDTYIYKEFEITESTRGSIKDYCLV